jgi:hypothetical protein
MMFAKTLSAVLLIAIATPLARSANYILQLRGPLENGCTWVEDEPTYEVWGFQNCTVEQMRDIRAAADRKADKRPPERVLDDKMLKDLSRR